MRDSSLRRERDSGAVLHQDQPDFEPVEKGRVQVARLTALAHLGQCRLDRRCMGHVGKIAQHPRSQRFSGTVPAMKGELRPRRGERSRQGGQQKAFGAGAPADSRENFEGHDRPAFKNARPGFEGCELQCTEDPLLGGFVCGEEHGQGCPSERGSPGAQSRTGEEPLRPGPQVARAFGAGGLAASLDDASESGGTCADRVVERRGFERGGDRGEARGGAADGVQVAELAAVERARAINVQAN
jgi:hypothetical protein